jgi:hypothetical protein
MRVLLALAALAALSTAAYAQEAEEQAPPVFTVIEENASLPFADRRIQDYQVARDDSLILRAGPSRWYRATVWETCANDLRWAYDHIGLDLRPNGTLNRFSTIIVRGQRCPIQTLDRIERPPPNSNY